MNVIVCNGCRHVCFSLKSIVTSAGYTVVGTFKSSDGLLRALEKSLPDVCILDIGLIGMDGFEIIRVLQRRYRVLKVLVVSEYVHPYTVQWMVKHGVRGYIPLSSSPRTIVAAVNGVIVDGYYYSRLAPRRLFEDIENNEVEVRKIVGRQKEVLKYLCQGLSTKEVARRMSLSRFTVEDYCQRTYPKLDLEDFNNTMRYLVCFAFETGLVRL